MTTPTSRKSNSAWNFRNITLACALYLLPITTLITGCVQSEKEPQDLLVFAATSLMGTLSEIEDALREEKNIYISVSYGGSQMLAQQIASGAPADVIISAGQSPIDFLDQKGMLELDRAAILSNRLVLVVRSDANAQIDSMQQLQNPHIKRIAIAEPTLAPAGRYAQESLKNLSLFNTLRPKIVFGSDVRATLAYVESGNAEAAIVYITDAISAHKAHILDIVPEGSYSRIVYPAAVVKDPKSKSKASAFIDFLQGPTAQEILRNHGFEPAQ